MFNITCLREHLKYIAVIMVICVVAAACSGKPSPSRVAVKINDYSLSVGEFNELFAELGGEDTPERRSEYLNALIIRKLLLQEAQRQGLDRQEDFLKSIENFWEQSLLKVVVDKKIKDVSGEIGVSEQEVAQYYSEYAEKNSEEAKPFEELGPVIRQMLLKERQAAAVGVWAEGLKKDSSIKINKKAIGIE